MSIFRILIILALLVMGCDDGDDGNGSGGGGWSAILVASGSGGGFTDRFYSAGGTVGFTVTHDCAGGFRAAATATTGTGVTFLSVPISGGGSTAYIPEGDYVIEIQCAGSWDLAMTGAVSKIYGGPRGQFPLAYQGEAMDCPSEIHCYDISKCADAYYYLEECGAENLDADDDGIPCEDLCGG